MSLVDYASSSEDEEFGEDKELQPNKGGKEDRRVEKSEPDESAAPSTAPPLFPRQPKTTYLSSTHHHPDVVMPSPSLSMEKLPDASVLFSSSFSQHQYVGTGHSSRISVSIAENASRKREQNGSTFSHLRNNKHPRGNLPHSRSIPETVSGSLIPPQLKGRSNVVTEDISRLFLNRRTREPSG